jgi:murein DD-endopeptidase MepM/ murein hydrolase activator NlpD
MLNTTSGTAKLRAIADMAKAYKDLNATLKETEKLTKSIATNVSAASGKKSNTAADAMSGANASNGRDSGNFMEQGSVPAGGTSQNGFKQAPSPGIGDSMKFAAATAGAAMNAGTDAGMYIENDISRRRYGFYNGVGGNAGAAMGSAQFNRTMRQGTAIDPLDAARAAMMGTQSGLGGATGMASAATMSNLVPGAGIAGGMGAMGALNQARNVNMARMIGINVRDDKTGMMKSFEDIANQIWDMLKRTKRDKGPITAAELSLSLQSGNSLSNMLDAYFGGDPVLREGVISALYQKASGGDFSKSSLEATGANPAISQSIGKRNAKKYSSQDQSTSGGIAGIIAGNDVQNAFTDALMSLGPIKEFLTMGTTFFQTALAGPGGAIAGSIAGLFTGGGTENAVENPTSGGGIGIGGGESTYAPIKGYSSHITSGYGPRKSPTGSGSGFHKGMDIGVPGGTPIHVPRDGKVVHIGANMDKKNGFGHNVTVEHADGYRTIYAHMMEAPMVSKGQLVSAGQQLGKVGTTGASTGNHLHFQVQKPGSSGTIDPKTWLGGTAPDPTGTASSMAGTTDSAAAPESNLFGTASEARSLFADPWQAKANAGRSGTGGGETEGSYAPSLGRVSSGGTVVNINVNGGSFNEEKLAQEVKRVLDGQDRVRMAVSR